MRARARRLARASTARIGGEIMADYLQLMRIPGSPATTAPTRFPDLAPLKALAKEFNCW